MNKWEQFHSSYSPIKAGSINQGAHRLDQDWNRFVLSNQATLNGVYLKDYAKNYMEEIKNEKGTTYNFKDDEAVKKFLSDVILKNLSSDKKEKALDFLEKSFHQGGLMYPVSASATDLLLNEKDRRIYLHHQKTCQKKSIFN